MFFLTSSVQSQTISICSKFLFVNSTDIRTENQIVYPCPVVYPCQCVCEKETRRLWIDCFHRQLKSFPQIRTILTDENPIEWNVDFALNLFETTINFLNQTNWLPKNLRIRHFVLSSSLNYDLIDQLNLTHRHLIDHWPSRTHFDVVDSDEEFQRKFSSKQNEQRNRISELTIELREKTRRIKHFRLSLAGEPPPITNLYLDHNELEQIPIDALYNATGLYEIYLSFNQIRYLPAFAFGFSHRLTRIDLSNNQIETIDINAFQRHPDAFAGPFLVDYLDLSHNQLTILDESFFSYLVNLRLLKLEHNQIHSLSAHLWTGLYRLKHLDLSHNHLDNITQVFYSGYINELTHLKLSANTLQEIGPCEFVTLKSLTKLNLNGNNLSLIDTCAFHGVRRSRHHSPFHVHLRSNQLEYLHPCTFDNFARSTIHFDNNPLKCNCSFNYLLQQRQSLVYTGRECRGGYVYPEQVHLSSPAVRKTNKTSARKSTTNLSNICRETFRFYDEFCSKTECESICAIQQRFIIEVTTIATPSHANENETKRTYFLLIFSSIFVFWKTCRFFVI